MNNQSKVLVASMLFIFIVSSGCSYSNTHNPVENITPRLERDEFNVAIWIDDTPPSISGPEDATYEAQMDNITLQWLLTDEYANQYTIYEDGNIAETNSWISGQNVNFTVGLRGLVSLNYTIYVNDTSGNTNLDTVLLTYVDTTAPSINHPEDVIKEFMDEGNITWQLGDYQAWDYPAPYWIYNNGTVVAEGEWDSDNEIVYSLLELDLGKFNITILASDASNNNVSDTVWVTVVDTTAPNISSPDDVEMSEGSTNNQISWICSDLDPSEYELLIEGESQFISEWNGENITYSLAGLEFGEWNVSLILSDGSGNHVSDSIIVIVLDTTAPVIEEIESTGFWVNGTTGNNITWTATDLHLASYTVYVNGTVYQQGSMNGISDTVVVFLDRLNVGTYNVTVSVFDTSGNSDSYTLIVLVEPEPPAIPAEILIGIGLTAVIGIVVVGFFILKKKGVP